MKLLKIKIIGLVCLFGLFSCTKKIGSNPDVIVKVGDKILTRTEIEENISGFSNGEDSVLAAKHFIREWINDNLLYDIASKNIVDKEYIGQLIDNYRKSIVICQYQEHLVNERLATDISREDLMHYYEDNKDRFKLEIFLVKGLFVKVPIGAPQIDKVRDWCKSITAAAMTNLEKYSVRNAAGFDCFIDKWIDFNEVMKNLPIECRDRMDYIKRNKFIEQKDGEYNYFLFVTDCLSEGSIPPFEYVQSTIKEILINQKKIEFLKKTEEDLYNKALNNGKITFY